eukprot:466876-Hanusia_phi.AAC.1
MTTWKTFDRRTTRKESISAGPAGLDEDLSCDPGVPAGDRDRGLCCQLLFKILPQLSRTGGH